MNLLNSMNVLMTTDSWDINESTWQIMKVKKKWVDCSSSMINDSENMMSE